MRCIRRSGASDTPSSHPASAQLIGRIEDTIDVHIAELGACSSVSTEARKNTREAWTQGASVH